MNHLKKAQKIDRLSQIYQLFDRTMEPFEFACGINCDACCTCNVTLTRLEADFLALHLGQKEKKRLTEKLQIISGRKRYKPRLTTNAFARYCVEGRAVPEEENDPDWGKCPLLVTSKCGAYQGRPFGCRVMASQIPCQESGFAQVPPLVQTFQNIFLQAVEHLDQGAIFGNLSDVLGFVLTQGQDQKDEQAQVFLTNEKIPVWMIPPEHRQKTGPLMQQLSQILQQKSG